MKINCLQTDIIWEDRDANFARVVTLVEEGKPEPGSLLVLPELFSVGFSMNLDKIAEPEEGPTYQLMVDLAKKYNVYVNGGFVTRGPDGRGRNESALIAPDGHLLTRYHKIHPFTFGEQQHYSAGDEIRVVALGDFQVAPFICYDLRFPEIFRVAASRGADLMIVIANWPVARIHHWTALLIARAIENQCYVVGVNRIGDDPTLHHTGHSCVVDPLGTVIMDAGEREGMFTAEIEIDNVLDVRARLPFLADMRSDFLCK
ncbi:MAG: carbon-nitrogen family hydrolase [Chthonomonadales bacterium]